MGTRHPGALILILSGGMALGVSATSVAAQPWTEAQQAVIDQVVRCADSWVQSLSAGSFDTWVEACPGVGEAANWYVQRPVPEAFGGPDGVWTRNQASGALHGWKDLEPVRVDVMGSVAMAYFQVTWDSEFSDGSTAIRTSRRLMVFRRDGDQWVWVGGTATYLG